MSWRTKPVSEWTEQDTSDYEKQYELIQELKATGEY